MRNAMAHLAPKQRPAVVAMLKTIFAQEDAEAAREQWAWRCHVNLESTHPS
jgi:transposase-like protein